MARIRETCVFAVCSVGILNAGGRDYHEYALVLFDFNGGAVLWLRDSVAVMLVGDLLLFGGFSAVWSFCPVLSCLVYWKWKFLRSNTRHASSR